MVHSPPSSTHERCGPHSAFAKLSDIGITMSSSKSDSTDGKAFAQVPSNVSALQEENASLRLLLEHKSHEFRSTQAALSEQLQQISSSLQSFKAESSAISVENEYSSKSNALSLPFSIKAESVQPRGKLESLREKSQSKLTHEFAAFAEDLKETVALHVKEVEQLQEKTQEQTSRVSFLEENLLSKEAYIQSLQDKANADTEKLKELQTIRLRFRAVEQEKTHLEQNLQDVSYQLRAERQRHEAEMKVDKDLHDLDTKREKDRLKSVWKRTVDQEKAAAEQLRRHVRDLQEALRSAERTHAAQVKGLQASNHALREQLASAENERLAQMSSRLFFEKQAKLHSSQLEKGKAATSRLKQQMAALSEQCCASQVELAQEQAQHQHCRQQLELMKRRSVEVDRLFHLKAGLQQCKQDLGGLKQLVNDQVAELPLLLKQSQMTVSLRRLGVNTRIFVKYVVF